MNLKAGFRRLEGCWLERIRAWWRPITCIGIAGGAIVNLIVIPLYKWEVPNMAEAAAYVTAATAAFAMRAFEKVKDVA